MTDADIKTGKELLKEEFITKNESWVRELELMVRSKQKAEIRAHFHLLLRIPLMPDATEALSNFGFQYLTNVYLPNKLAELLDL